MSEILKYFQEQFINKLPIDNNRFIETINHFATTALTTSRGYQKDTGVRELSECIFWLVNEYLTHDNSLVHLLDDFYEFTEFDFTVYPETLHTSLFDLWTESQINTSSVVYLRPLKINKQIKMLIDSKFFPNGVTKAQAYFIEGVVECMNEEFINEAN
jgi:hypothetical protein